MTRLTAQQYIRYERHIELREVGEAGQARLLNAGVLIVGAGGLGTPAAAYLAAGGIGRLGIIDDDVVSRTNLQRQFLYTDQDEGRAKVECLRDALKKTSPATDVEPIRARLDEENAETVISRYDLVLDGSDNFQTKYLLNDICLRQKKPLVYGAVLHFDGQATVFRGYEDNQPCYKCLYPDVPEHLVPSCSESAVLGPMVGVIGAIQAAEAMKTLLGLPDLAGSLLLYSALSANFIKTAIAKRPGCPACGQ